MLTPRISRRQLTNWSATVADIRKARRQSPVSFRKADGTYDLAAIMSEAHRAARRYPSLPTHSRRMAVALRVVWGRAKAERLGRAH
jgi:hypothetical protein